MTRELLILRHGKSDWGTADDDFHRPLTERGRHSARRMAIWMVEQKLMPDHVVASPAERALATARKACKTMGLSPKTIHKDPRVYEAGPDELLRVLADCPGTARRVMLVGHNPGLEDLPIPCTEPTFDRWTHDTWRMDVEIASRVHGRPAVEFEDVWFEYDLNDFKWYNSVFLSRMLKIVNNLWFF